MDLIEIGEAVKLKRKARDLTQAQLAKQSGISRTTINSLENGQLLELGVGRIIRLLEVLGLELKVEQAEVFRPSLDEIYAMNDQQLAERSRSKPGRNRG